MMRLSVHKDAQQDLDLLKAVDPDAVATVAVFLQEASGERLAELLTTVGNVRVGSFVAGIKEWSKAQQTRPSANLWRLRLLDTPATSCRLIYAYHWQTRQLVVLAVLRKISDDEFAEDFDYDDLNSPIAIRMLAAWNSLS
jgi:hypothetical protein